MLTAWCQNFSTYIYMYKYPRKNRQKLFVTFLSNRKHPDGASHSNKHC